MIIANVQNQKMQFDPVYVSELKLGDLFMLDRKDNSLRVVEKRQQTQIKYYDNRGDLKKLANSEKVFLYVEPIVSNLETVQDGLKFTISVGSDLYKRLCAFSFGIACQSVTTNKVHYFRKGLDVIQQDVNV